MIMDLAINEARKTINKNYGGPFGAVVVDKDNNVVAVSSNTVLKSHDPTAHAEINAIRQACQKLNTHNLEGYKIYTTGYPCPMCLSAIIWANIKEVYYGTDYKQAEVLGFRDDFIYEYLNGNKKDILKTSQTDEEKCLKLFEEYLLEDKQIY